MATDRLNVVFNGITPVSRLPGQGEREWFGTAPDTARMETYNVYHSVPGNDLDATADFSGSNWNIRYFRIAGDDHKTTIRDLDNGADRRIDTMLLGFNSEVDLISTEIDFIYGWDGARHDIQLGDQTTRSVRALEVYADLNIIDTGSTYVHSIKTDTGENQSRINIGDAGAGQVRTGGGNDRLVVEAGVVEAVNTGRGNDTITVREGGRIENLKGFEGIKTIIVNDSGRLDQFRGGDGEVNVTLVGQARMETLTSFNSTLTVETDERFINVIKGFNNETDIKIGAGGVGIINMDSDTKQKHKIVVDGSAEVIRITDLDGVAGDDQSTNLTLKGYAGTVLLGNGRDVVKTGSEYVETISTAGGNDVVNLGTGGSAFVRTGDGNDRVNLSALPSDFGVILHGGRGVDTLDFKKFKSGVMFSLDEVGRFQNVTAPEGDLDTPADGVFSESGFENLNGTGKADTLTGDFADNKLAGRGGNDRLAGLEGNDLLIGAKGRDTFVFAADGGTDRIKGFQKGQDTLEILDNSGGFRTLDIARAGKNLEVEYDGGMIVLLGKSGMKLSADDFDFV